jgi:hypothetical protein
VIKVGAYVFLYAEHFQNGWNGLFRLGGNIAVDAFTPRRRNRMSTSDVPEDLAADFLSPPWIDAMEEGIVQANKI